jgi:hypothetical protein
MYLAGTNVTDFASLPHREKQAITQALIEAAAEQWGDPCYPAADMNDKRLFNMRDIIDWINSLKGD